MNLSIAKRNRWKQSGAALCMISVMMSLSTVIGCAAQPQPVAESSDAVTLRRGTLTSNAMVNAPNVGALHLGAGDRLGQQLFTSYLTQLRNDQPGLFSDVDAVSADAEPLRP